MLLPQRFTVNGFASKAVQPFHSLKPCLPRLTPFLEQTGCEYRDAIHQLGADSEEGFDPTPDSADGETRLLCVSPINGGFKSKPERFALTGKPVENIKVCGDPRCIAG